MVGYISDHLNVMEEKEKLPLRNKDSLADLRQMIQHANLSTHSDFDTTDSFSDTTVERKRQETTEDNSDESSYETSDDEAIAKPLTTAITQLVIKLVDEKIRPPIVQKFQHNYIIDATILKKTVHDIENGITIAKKDKKIKKEALVTIRLNTVVDKIKNHVDKILITKYDKIVKTARKSKYQYKIYELPYHKKNPLIDDILNALNNYKGFEYIAYTDTGIFNKPYKIYIKLDYVWSS